MRSSRVSAVLIAAVCAGFGPGAAGFGVVAVDGGVGGGVGATGGEGGASAGADAGAGAVAVGLSVGFLLTGLLRKKWAGFLAGFLRIQGKCPAEGCAGQRHRGDFYGFLAKGGVCLESGIGCKCRAQVSGAGGIRIKTFWGCGSAVQSWYRITHGDSHYIARELHGDFI
jgi:hypothetical protein